MNEAEEKTSTEKISVEATIHCQTSNPNLTQRGIGVSILLSIVTCGIYGIYWFIKLTDETNSVSKDNKTASGGVAFLLSIVTCGIYGIYWAYKLGKKMHEAGKTYGLDIADNSVLYMILDFFGLTIVAWAIVQSDLNKIATK